MKSTIESSLVLVTGATGHIGNVLVRELRERGYRVRALVLPGESLTPLEQSDLEIFEGNVLDPPSLERAMEGVEGVFHLAGIISIMPGDDEKVRRVNVDGTVNVIRAARRTGVKRLLHTSSIHALKRVEGVIIDESLPFDPDNPVGIYDRTKAEASLKVLEAVEEGLDAVIVCPTGVVGPHDYLGSELGNLILGWLKAGVSLLIDGAYDFVDVRDVAQGMILAYEHGRSGAVYILGGEQMQITRMRQLVRDITGLPGKVLKIPSRLALFFANFTPLYYRLSGAKPRFTRYSLVTVMGNSRISSERARRELGYRPRALRESLADTVSWWQTRRRRG
jgi:dihydroflavonol-4-reductase